MYRFTMLFVFALIIGSLEAQTLVGEWDFTKGSINSTNGKFEASPRGITQISGDDQTGKYLSIGMTNKDKPEGIIMKEKYPELTPGEGFRIDARVRLREQTSTKIMMVIWDSKYIYYRHPQHSPNHDRGMAFYLIRQKDNRITPYLCIGCGDKGSEAIPGKPMTMNENQIYTLSVSYDGAGEITFRQDDQINAVRRGKIGAPIVSAFQKTVIGDRVGSGYSRFDGDIFNVKLFSLPLKK